MVQIYYAHGLENSNCEDINTHQFDIEIQHNPNQNSKKPFFGNEQAGSKIHMEIHTT